MKYLLVIFLLFPHLVMANNLSIDQEFSEIIDHHQDHPELSLLLTELLDQNPLIQSKFYQVKAAHYQKTAESWIDDPKVGFNLSNIPVDNPSFSRTPMSGKEISVEQMIPFPTKLITQNKIGEARYQSIKSSYLELVHQVVNDFKQAYFEFSYLHQALGINQQNLDRLNSLSDLLKSKYTTDSLALHDLLEVDIQINQMNLSIIQLESLIKTYQARLNSLLNRKSLSKIKPYQLVKLNDYPDLDQLIDQALTHRNLIKEYDEKINQRKKENSLAKQGFLPDFKIMASYRTREDIPNDPVNGENFFSGGVGINLPFLWSSPRHLGQIQKTKAMIYSAEKEKEMMMNEIKFEVTSNFQKLAQLKSQIDLMKNQIITKSMASLNSSKNSFEADNVDFQDLIRAQNSLYNYELSLIRYQFDYEKTRSNLARSVGEFF